MFRWTLSFKKGQQAEMIVLDPKVNRMYVSTQELWQLFPHSVLSTQDLQYFYVNEF